MKISEALQAQKAISQEIAHRRGLETQKAWSYRSMETPDAEMKANFDFEKNHEDTKKLSRLYTKLGIAISRTNLEKDIIGLNEEDLKELAEWV
jgi:flagellin-specific chaperone FliS